MEINIPITKDNYYKGFLKVINSFLGLTKGELEIIVAMLEYDVTTLDRDSRKMIREAINKDQFAFNNLILKLKQSNTLIKTRNGLSINPLMINNIANKTIKINFHIKDERLSGIGENELSNIPYNQPV